MKSLSTIRDRLARLAATVPSEQDDHLFCGNSEQAFAELRALLDFVEANPSTEVEPFDPSKYPPEVVAMVERMERMVREMVWSDEQGCFVEPATVAP